MIIGILSAIGVVLLFGLTIFIHELGHFIAARCLGLKAEVFSIGFGHAIWKKKIDGVMYKVGWMPLGGYVALPQMDPGGLETGGDKEGEDEEPREELAAVAPWKKIIVALAGPFGNLVLAFLIAFIISWVGKPAGPEEVSSTIGFVETNSTAYAQGVRPGQDILKVNDNSVNNWMDIMLDAASFNELTITVQPRTGAVFTASLTTTNITRDIRGLPSLVPIGYCKVAAPIPGSSAAEAGVKREDLITHFNGRKVWSIPHLSFLVNQHVGEAVPMTVKRGETSLDLMVVPKVDESLGRALVGVQFNSAYVESDQRIYPSPQEQLKVHFAMIIKTLKRLVSPETSKNTASGIVGPVGIVYYLWLVLKSSFVMALWFMCFLNVNLIILNLLPLPVLDGGHIVFSIWEAITGKPVHPKIVGFLWRIFAFLLFGLMIFLVFRDSLRFFPQKSEAPAAAHAVESTNNPAASD